VIPPASATVENLFPYLPSTTSNNFSPNLISTGPLNNGIFKGDYTPGPHHHISGMYFVSKSTQLVNSSAAQLLPQWEVFAVNDVQMFEGSWTWTPNSTWLNDVRLGFAYLNNNTLLADYTKVASDP
jgi:hypothetical protein